MKRSLLILYLAFSSGLVLAQNQKTLKPANTANSNTDIAKKPDTVKVGIFINSIHDIDFKLKEFVVSFWLWIKYTKHKDKKDDLDFVNNLEIPNAEKFERSYLMVDSTSGLEDSTISMTMKMVCEMKDNWSISNFPYDKQMMNISIENSQFDATKMVFVRDTVGHTYDSSAIFGWHITKDSLWVESKTYYSKFGDDSQPEPKMKFSSFKTRIYIQRESWSLFWKMFLGMYIAFLIAYICFYIHSNGMDSRFGLSVGSLFAVIGNKYIIDSSLPESTSFTLVDTLHGLTLFCIFLVISATAWSLKLVTQNKEARARRFDMAFAQTMLLLYIILNIFFIYQAR